MSSTEAALSMRTCVSLVVALSATRVALAQPPLPVARFRAETTVDRLSPVLSVTNLDGEQDYRANVSGCCVMPSTGDLLMIMNRSSNFSKPPAIQVYSTDGAYLRHISLTGFDDTEGLCQYDPDRDEYAIVEETRNEITIVTITPATTNIVKASGRTIATGIPVGADGLEGVTYDRRNGIFYVLQEVPMAVFRVTTNGGVVVSEELFDAGAVFEGICTDLSDLFHDPVSGHLLILSDEGNVLMECELDGTILTVLPVAGTQPEGIAVSDAGTEVYICGEPNEYYRYTVGPLRADAAEGTAIDLPVDLNTAPTGSVSVGYTISSDVALPALDFGLPVSGTLTFGPDCLCATVTVDILKDTVVEGVEMLRIALTNAVNAGLGADHVYELDIVNGTADAPALLERPFDCEVTRDTTPSFTFWSSDPDGVAGMIYEIRWSTDSSFETGVTVRSSVSDAGFENVANGSDTNPFTEGQQVRFTLQDEDALSDTPDDTVYYWQVRACDSAAEWGSGTFGEWNPPRSLGVDSRRDLSGWRQTTAEQFSRADMDGTEVSVSDSVWLGMASIGFDNAASGRAQPGDTITISGFAVADMPDRLLVLGVALPDGGTVNSASYAGVPLVPLDSALNGAQMGAHLWYLVNPPATVGQVLVSLSAPNAAIAGVSSWYNVNQDDPFGSAAKATGTGRSASVHVPGEPGCTILDLIAVRSGLVPTADSGQTGRWGQSSRVFGFPPRLASGGSSSKSGVSSATMSWAFDDGRDRGWALLGVPLRSAASRAGTIMSPAIDFDWVPSVGAWGEVTFSEDALVGDVTYGIQYWDGDGWRDTDIRDRDASPIDISRLDPVVHNRIRLKALLTRGSGTPQLLDWAVSWASVSACRIMSSDLDQGCLRLLWSSATGRCYSVYCSTNLLAPWPLNPLTNGIRADVSGTNRVMIPLNIAPRAYYRIEVQLE